MPGKQVTEESVADNGGYYLSYYAYNSSQGGSAEMSLPGFEKFTSKQMFWISYATAWCEKYDPHDIVYLIKDLHSINYLRVYGGLQNSKEFAQDFKCAIGSGMNPEKKCAFWDM